MERSEWSALTIETFEDEEANLTRHLLGRAELVCEENFGTEITAAGTRIPQVRSVCLFIFRWKLASSAERLQAQWLRLSSAARSGSVFYTYCGPPELCIHCN